MNFPFLPRVYKDPLKATPIIPYTIVLTQNVSANPKQAVPTSNERVTSHCKNSTNLIKIIESLPVHTNAHLINLDIESLYTNISSEEAITVSFL